MRKVEEVRLLGDQVLVRCLGTADKEGSIHIPETAQDARKIHRNGGDYLHRGEVLAVGPGDKVLEFFCTKALSGDSLLGCRFTQYRLEQRMFVRDTETRLVAQSPLCGFCGEPMDLKGTRRDEVMAKPGDIVLYENRRDAQLQPKRFPSLDLEDDTLIVLREEQHILAVLEAA